MEVGGNLPRKSNTKGSKPTINKSGITTVQNSTEINNIKPIEPVKERVYQCCSCGKEYKKQDRNFAYSHSPMFKGNNSRLPICYNCLNNLVEQYTEMLGSQDEAIKRVCLHWDMYVSESILKSSKKIDANRSRISCYVRNCNLSQDAGKTYDTYLKEVDSDKINTIEDLEEAKDNKDFKVQQKTIKFFGLGYSAEEYAFLQSQYEDWTKRHVCETKTQEELFKNLCIAQLNINIAQHNNGKVAEAMKTFQDLLGSANLKPAQNNDNTLSDTNTFGTLIKKWEDEKPIPEPDPEWKDVDGIIRYISIYFLGHLCKMMRIKNSYSKMYEEEMTKYKVEKPEYEDDDEALFDSVFGESINDTDK